MSHEIKLSVELPDGSTVVSRHMPRELGMAPERASYPDYLAWLGQELTEAVAQLYVRANLPDPLATLYDALPVGVPHTPDTLAAFVTGMDAARAALHATAKELGVDPAGRPVDVRTGLMANAHWLARVAADVMRQRNEDRELAGRHSLYLAQIHNQLSAAPVLERDVPDLVRKALQDLREEVDERGTILDRVKEAAGLRAEDDVADADLPTIVGNLSRSDAAEELNRVTAALGMEGIANPAEVLAELKKRAARGALTDVLIMFGLECDSDEEPMSRLADLFAAERQRCHEEAVRTILSAFDVSFETWREDPVGGLRNKFRDEIEAERSGAELRGRQGAARELELLRGEFGNVREERNTMREHADKAVGALNDVRGALAALTGDNALGSVLEHPDADLAVLVRHLTLTERYPAGSPVKVYSGSGGVRDATVRAVSATSLDNDPIMVLFGDGSRETLPVSRVARPGEFLDGNGRRGRAFHLPEDGLKEILSESPALRTVDSVLDEVSGRLAGFGSQVVARLDELSAKAAAKLTDLKDGR